jgi:hypothetical protein
MLAPTPFHAQGGAINSGTSSTASLVLLSTAVAHDKHFTSVLRERSTACTLMHYDMLGKAAVPHVNQTRLDRQQPPHPALNAFASIPFSSQQ